MYCNDNWKNEKDDNQHPHIAQQKLLNGKRKTTLKRYLYHKYLNYRTHAVQCTPTIFLAKNTACFQ